MEDGRSRTAQSVAVARAIETRRPERVRLFSDPHAARLLFSLPTRLVARAFGLPPVRAAVAAVYDRAFPGVMGGLVTRTRFLDEAFAEGLASAEQAVILGVGLDSRAFRIPDHPEVPVFEVDRAANLAWKRDRLRGTNASRRVIETPIDFERESLGEALARAGLRKDAPTFFLWEGVTQYLTDEAVDATLGYVASRAPGSRLAFTYIVPEGLASASAISAAKVGEPWVSSITPAALARRAGEQGLETVADLGHAELRARYLVPLGRADRHWEVERVAVVEVPAR